MDNAANFCRGAISAVGNITATTLTYTLAGPTAFPTPDAGNYNPDVGYNCTVWMSGTYNSPDLDPNAAIFRVTSETSTVLTGYFTEGTTQPTVAGTYSVAMCPTEKTRDDLVAPDYAEPYELFVTQNDDFEVAEANAATIGFFKSTATGWSNVAGQSAWKYTTTAVAGIFSYMGRINGAAWDTGQVLSSLGPRFSHRVKFNLNPSSGVNASALGIYGFVDTSVGPANAAGYNSVGTGHGIFFRVDSVNAGTTILQCVNKIGTTETVTNLTPVGGLNQSMTLEIIADSTQALFYCSVPLQTQLTATQTTNITTATQGWYCGFDTTSTNIESFSIDWVKMQRPR